MSSITIELSEELEKAAAWIAERDNMSVKEFVEQAIREKLSGQRGLEYLQERAKRADRAKWDAFWAKVPDVEPEDYDKI